MSTFIRLLGESAKGGALLAACNKFRKGKSDCGISLADVSTFDVVPGKPFAYWVSDCVRDSFARFPPVRSRGREAWMGLSTGANLQWLRLMWEVSPDSIAGNEHDSTTGRHWVFLAKGGEFASFYQDIHVVVNWSMGGDALSKWKLAELAMGRITENNSKCWNRSKYFRPGITWSARSQKGASFRVLPPNVIFGSKGPAIVVDSDAHDAVLSLTALTNSAPFRLLLSVQMAFGSYEVGVIQRTPIPDMSSEQRRRLAALAGRAWSLKRNRDAVNETSRAFLLPEVLLHSLGRHDTAAIDAGLSAIQAEVDAVAFELYGFSEADHQAAGGAAGGSDEGGASDDEGENGDESATSYADDDADECDEGSTADAPSADTLLSWSTGVAFGRFDWRLATGERNAAPDPDPFDPLPAKSPGMLPDGAAPFHGHAGILVDDHGHPHDLARLVEEVLERVRVPVPSDVRRWLQKDFFAFHLQRYSKSRRKAPIYWPLATDSGSYTLWVYYPTLNDQTLYRAVNDFVEPKLKQVSERVSQLRSKGSDRRRAEEREFEEIESLEAELTDFRNSLLKIAKNYHPNQDDGVQITAAPLWTLFRHKPWQKVLKDTWGKLENGEYDWAYLAMNYWPERVREKCKTDKSLAIAHGLEDGYIASVVESKRGRAGSKQ